MIMINQNTDMSNVKFIRIWIAINLSNSNIIIIIMI